MPCHGIEPLSIVKSPFTGSSSGWVDGDASGNAVLPDLHPQPHLKPRPSHQVGSLSPVESEKYIYAMPLNNGTVPFKHIDSHILQITLILKIILDTCDFVGLYSI
jgi:hypothetical protein